MEENTTLIFCLYAAGLVISGLLYAYRLGRQGEKRPAAGPGGTPPNGRSRAGLFSIRAVRRDAAASCFLKTPEQPGENERHIKHLQIA